ncbi:MAG: sugar phosphate isomerase/epimerase [Phycisphaeraceae bacterium]
MIYSGLVSVTFRKFGPEKIVDLVTRAGLTGIEWGGDVHVPHGEVNRADEVGRMTREAGLRVAAYGSYYFLGYSESEGLSFDRVLETAVALQAPTIRLWAGRKGTAEADEADWNRVVDDARRVADLAEQAGVRVCLECHGGTLTDNHIDAMRLYRRIGSENLDLLWQPLHHHLYPTQLEALRSTLGVMSNAHVYWWVQLPGREHPTRLPLAEGADVWSVFLSVMNNSPADRYALLEFVRDDDETQFFRDADTLCGLIQKHASPTLQQAPVTE